MDWSNIPTGMIRNDRLLNALLALWKTQTGIASRKSSDEFSQGYQLGFEEGLDAIAQMAGLSEVFEIRKAEQRVKLEARLKDKDVIDFVDGQISVVDPPKLP